MRLEELVVRAAADAPERTAVSAPDGTVTYGELDREVDCLAAALAELGVGRGDRVVVWLEKSVKAVASLQAALRLGATYVPVDPAAPAERAAHVIADCAPRVVVSTRLGAEQARQEDRTWLCVDQRDEGGPGVPWSVVERDAPARRPTLDHPEEHELAYILYTSGSTGSPKGVCVSHANAMAFVEWARDTIAAAPEDRFSNHAPLNFDLSVLDLYVAFSVGAPVVLVPERLAYSPRSLVEFIRDERISVWYSVPSALVAMMRDGGLLETDLPDLRTVIFAGEPFPVVHLRRLREAWPRARLLNLYGPTETNVCTGHEVAADTDWEAASVPIGHPASGDEVWAERPDGALAAPGEEGELVVRGPTVMLGYWGGEPVEPGTHYRTGDWVEVLDDGSFRFLSRIDDMVKVRGYRVHLGEVETALAAHPEIDEAAVLPVGHDIDTRLVAYAVPAGDASPSLLGIKRHCSERLPHYMIIDAIDYLDRLPRNQNGKLDRDALDRLAQAGA